MKLSRFPAKAILTITLSLGTTVATIAPSKAGFKSPFPSDVPGLSIGNASFVSSSGKVIRGSQPDNATLIAELVRLGITDIVILKDSPENQIRSEVESLQNQRINPQQISLLPLSWKEPESWKVACKKSRSRATSIIICRTHTESKSLFSLPRRVKTARE